MVSRRNFIRKGALWLPAAYAGFNILVPKAHGQVVTARRAARIPPAGSTCDVDFCEDFRTSYQNAGWTETNATITEGTSTAAYSGLPGSTCVLFNPSSIASLHRTIGSYSEIYWKWAFHMPTSGEAWTFTLGNEGAMVGQVVFHNGQHKFFVTQGATSSGFGAVLSDSTTYWQWGYFKVSTGSNGIMRIWVNTVDSKPAMADCEVTTGAGTDNITRVTWSITNPVDLAVSAYKHDNALIL